MHPTDRLNNVLFHRVLREYLLSISRTWRLEERGIPEVSQVKKGERASIERQEVLHRCDKVEST